MKELAPGYAWSLNARHGNDLTMVSFCYLRFVLEALGIIHPDEIT